MSTNEEEQIPISEKPGERLKRLRQELQMQMAQKRSVLWQQKSDLQCNEKESPNENREFDQVEEEDILDDEDEEELTDSEVEDSVEDDNDHDIKLNPKSIFLDDEVCFATLLFYFSFIDCFCYRQKKVILTRMILIKMRMMMKV